MFAENFSNETWFERAIFFSWYCAAGDCRFCLMSGGRHKQGARRSQESILAEAILCRMLGWKVGFISGGQKAYAVPEFLELLKGIHRINGRVWLNIGVLEKQELAGYLPYASGVVAAVETMDKSLQQKLCPSKPIERFETMLRSARRLGLKRAMTVIIGLGETIADFGLLKDFIARHGITKLHIYSLNPQKGTFFENAKPPSPEYHAEWIARTRIAFPKIDIQAGIWLDRVKSVALLLEAGANSISKFPAIRHFGGPFALEIERQAALAGRVFRGSLSEPAFESQEQLLELIDTEKKEKVREKLERYKAVIHSAGRRQASA